MKYLQSNPPLSCLPPLFLPAMAIALVAVGCSAEQSVYESTATTTVTPEIQPGSADTLPAATSVQTVDDAPPAQSETPPPSSLIDKTKKFLDDAAETGSLQAADAQSMVGELIGGLRQSTEKAAGDSITVTGDAMEWANETFQSLKEQGGTSASNTGQWLAEDWSNMESWEYKIEPLGAPTDVADLEKQLNELGKLGWDCFYVDDTKMMFKKPRQSYLKRLPFKDLLRLAPLINQEK